MRHADVRIIREVLEESLSSAATSAILFEALDHGDGAIPQSSDDLHELVQGPLAEALRRQLGDEQAGELLSSVESRLRLEEADASGTRPRTGFGAGSSRDDEATTAVPTATDPVSVAVVAQGEAFAKRLGVVLGPRRVAPFGVASVEDLWGLATAPALVLVDCTDFAPVEAEDLARALSSMPSTTVRAVWGSNLPYGRSLVAALTRADVAHTPIDRKEGLEPLLDLIRARQRA